jgi:exopolysaccharide biosynthesis polyprenyl glycosylphosphotransferase
MTASGTTTENEDPGQLPGHGNASAAVGIEVPTVHSPSMRPPGRTRFATLNVRAPVPVIDAGSVADLGRTGHPDWLRRYQLGLGVIDGVAASLAGILAYALRFRSANFGSVDLFAAALLPFAWLVVIHLNGAYERRFVGVGATEFQRILRAFLHLTVLVTFASFVSKADLARGFVLLALVLALTFDLAGRYAARKWLHRRRVRGYALASVLLVGDAESIVSFATILQRDRYAGMRPIGACVPPSLVHDPTTLQALAKLDLPLFGDVDSIATAVRMSRADTIAVVSSAAIGPEKLRWISWQLEGSSVSLVVSPGLTEVAGPRLHVQPVAGLPLLHVEEPRFTGLHRVAKATFDRSVAALAIFVLLPLILVLWGAVRFSSTGPGFFRQTRVGRNGQLFTIFKFRSMFVDAEARLDVLQSANVNADGLLFKIRDDPRQTPVGRILRRLSLDELPQLFNVLNGTMSLVGPRPPLPTEAARYGEDVRRRLLVKPGLTGLWQISGRSDLTWDEAVRLDLRYVENWSFALDIMILFKTVGAVARGSGAY